jgi:hypothetical protein
MLKAVKALRGNVIDLTGSEHFHAAVVFYLRERRTG